MLDVDKTLAEIEALHEKQPLQDHPLTRASSMAISTSGRSRNM